MLLPYFLLQEFKNCSSTTGQEFKNGVAAAIPFVIYGIVNAHSVLFEEKGQNNK
jgi:hypothetical protein